MGIYLLWTECLWPSEFIYWNLNPQGEDTWRVGAFGRWLGHEAGVLMNGMSACIKGPPGGSCLFTTTVHDEEVLAMDQERAFTRTWLCCCFWSRTSSIPNCERCIFVVYKSPSLRYLAIAVSMVLRRRVRVSNWQEVDLWQLVYVNLSRLRCLVYWPNASLNIAVKVHIRYD